MKEPIIETCKCGCFIFDKDCKKCVNCGTERIDPVAIPNGGVDKEEVFQHFEEDDLSLAMEGYKIQEEITCMQFLEMIKHNHPEVLKEFIDKHYGK